ESPAICPAALMAAAWLDPPPRVPRSVMIPRCHRNACSSRFPGGVLSPITWPAAFRSTAALAGPPRVPSPTVRYAAAAATRGCASPLDRVASSPAPGPLHGSSHAATTRQAKSAEALTQLELWFGMMSLILAG